MKPVSFFNQSELEFVDGVLFDRMVPMVELGRVAGDSMKCDLYFRLSKPESGLICPESR